MGNSADKASESAMFNNFMTELHDAKPQNALIFVIVTFETTFLNAYDPVVLNNTANYLILEGYRFHKADSPFTGHHSPLFMDGKLLDEETKTVESFTRTWTSFRIPKNRLIIGYSAAGTTMSLIKDDTKTRADNEDEESFIGQKTDRADVRMDRSSGPGLVSQTELCEELSHQAKHQYIAELGVPVAKKGDEFFAYDDKRSIQVIEFLYR
jgi:hypothetical protein